MNVIRNRLSEHFNINLKNTRGRDSDDLTDINELKKLNRRVCARINEHAYIRCIKSAKMLFNFLPVVIYATHIGNLMTIRYEIKLC